MKIIHSHIILTPWDETFMVEHATTALDPDGFTDGLGDGALFVGGWVVYFRIR